VITEVLGEFASAAARTFDAREQTVGASDVGRCARRVFFEKNEGDPDYGAPRNHDATDGWGARLRGTIFEQHVWVPALRAKFGERLLFAGEGQETFALGFLSATPDALIVALDGNVLAPLGVPDIGGDGSLVTECKTIDPRAKLNEARLAHVYQAQVQLGLIRALTRHRPEYALISYVDASFWDTVYEFPIKRDPEIFETAHRRASQILTAQSAVALAPEGWITGGRECERCAFSRACGNMRGAVPTRAVEASPAQAAAIVALALEVERCAQEADAATAAQREAEHEIKEMMRAANVRRVVAAGVSVLWSAVKGRPSYDMPAIRAAATAAGVDLTKFEKTGEPTDRLVIRAGNPARPPEGSKQRVKSWRRV
jgi:hypothetical protein